MMSNHRLRTNFMKHGLIVTSCLLGHVESLYNYLTYMSYSNVSTVVAGLSAAQLSCQASAGFGGGDSRLYLPRGSGDCIASALGVAMLMERWVL